MIFVQNYATQVTGEIKPWSHCICLWFVVLLEQRKKVRRIKFSGIYAGMYNSYCVHVSPRMLSIIEEIFL